MENNKITAMITLTLFFIGVAAVSMFSTGFAFGAIDYFNVTVTVTGGAAPNITAISIVTATPTTAGTTTAYVLMNITDLQGGKTIDASNTYVEIMLGGVTITGSTGCTNYTPWFTPGTIYRSLNCTVDLEYYRAPGDWNISGYTQDDEANSDSEINGSTLTYGSLSAFRLESNNISFTGPAAGARLFDNIWLNNTGNVAFSTVNVTATDLSGGIGKTIGAGNFSGNTVEAYGDQLSTSPVDISGASLPYGAPGIGQTRLYFSLDIPVTASTGQYNSTGQWTIGVHN